MAEKLSEKKLNTYEENLNTKKPSDFSEKNRKDVLLNELFYYFRIFARTRQANSNTHTH